MSQIPGDQWVRSDVLDVHGRLIGTIAGYRPGEDSSTFEFMIIDQGFLGSPGLLVPLALASFDGGVVQLQVAREVVDGAPVHGETVDSPAIGPAGASGLRHYYGLEARPGPAGTTPSETDDDLVMVRSEEVLQAQTTVVESGRVRLRKYVTTEMQTITVPVRREHVVLESVPLEPMAGPPTADPAALFTPEVTALFEVVLYEEQAQTSTVVVPVERVRVSRRTAYSDVDVTGEVRKENIELIEHPPSV